MNLIRMILIRHSYKNRYQSLPRWIDPLLFGLSDYLLAEIKAENIRVPIVVYSSHPT